MGVLGSCLDLRVGRGLSDPEVSTVGFTTAQADDCGLTTAAVEFDLLQAIARPWTYETDPRESLALLADKDWRVLVGAWAVTAGVVGDLVAGKHGRGPDGGSGSTMQPLASAPASGSTCSATRFAQLPTWTEVTSLTLSGSTPAMPW